MKLVHTCLSIRRDLESSFHHCGGPVWLVPTSLGARKELERAYH